MELGVLVVLINNVLTLTVGDPEDASIVLIITVQYMVTLMIRVKVSLGVQSGQELGHKCILAPRLMYGDTYLMYDTHTKCMVTRVWGSGGRPGRKVVKLCSAAPHLTLHCCSRVRG